MKSKIAVILMVLMLTGCGDISRSIASITGTGTATCIDGVVYLQFTSGASVAYNTDGSIKTCK